MLCTKPSDSDATESALLQALAPAGHVGINALGTGVVQATLVRSPATPPGYLFEGMTDHEIADWLG